MSRLARLVVAGFRHAIFRTAAVNMAMLAATTVAGILVARALGEYGRGHYASIVAAQGIAFVVAELGQSVAVTYAVSRQPGRRLEIVSRSRRIMVPLAVTISVISCGAAYPLAQGDSAVWFGYLLAFTTLLLNAIGGPALYALQAVSIPIWNRVRFLQPVAYLGMNVAFFAGGALSIITASAALLASQGVTAAGAMLALRSRTSTRDDSDEDPVPLVSFGLKQSASAIPETLAANLDRVLLIGIVGAAPLGQYAVAQSVMSAAGPLGTAVSSVAFPSLAADTSKASVRTRREYRLILGTGALTMTALVVLGAIAPWAVPLLFGAAFVPAAALVWWLAPAIFLRTVLRICATILRGRGVPGLASVATVVSFVSTTALLIILGSIHGVLGAAVATALGQGAGLIVCLALLVRSRRG